MDEDARVHEVVPYAPGAPVRFGTSSFSSADWVGPFYPRGMRPPEFLRHYAQQFCTVEVDATWYAPPDDRLVDGWAEKTPPEFLLCAKFPRGIVHGGEGTAPDARRVLAPDATYEMRDRFLSTMARLGPRLGPLLLQFPFFPRGSFPSAGPFLERLDAFLRHLPREPFAYAVEVRNRAWLGEPLRRLLAHHRVSWVLTDMAGMPHGDELESRLDTVTGPWVYVRLLGDRHAIEQITRRWDREVVDHADRLDRWARLLARMTARGLRSLVYVNNHYAGHAPTTVRRLRDRYAAIRCAHPA
jgi:uncharacterized protein YecE (DUF72 family)